MAPNLGMPTPKPSFMYILSNSGKKVKEMFILTGSQQFNLLDSINQSLAGRTAIISLLPYSLKEISSYYKEPPSYDELIFKGSYPKLYEEDIPVEAFMRDYVKTYVERDVKEISELKNLHLFQKFLKLCTGQVCCHHFLLILKSSLLNHRRIL
jgi:uncharacterized protein